MSSLDASKPLVTVWVDKFLAGWDGQGQPPCWAPSMPLLDAMQQAYATDAHFVPYCLEIDGEDGWSISNRAPRVTLKAVPAVHANSGRLRFGYGVADVDHPEAHASGAQVPDVWRVAMRALAEAVVPGCLWFDTRGGMRVIWAWPRMLDEQEHAAMTTRALRHLRAMGLPCDDLTDWGRCYRLPFVRRDGTDQRLDANIREPLPWVAPQTAMIRSDSGGGQESSENTSIWDRAAHIVPRFALPEVIPAGQRHNTLKKYAASLRAKGMDEAGITESLQAAAETYYAAHGKSSDADTDLEKIVQWVCAFDAGPSTPTRAQPPEPVKIVGLAVSDADFDHIFERGDSFEVAQFVLNLLDRLSGHPVVYSSGEVWSYVAQFGRFVVMDKHTLYRLVGRCAGMWVKGRMTQKGQQYTPLKLAGSTVYDILRVMYEQRWEDGYFSKCEGVAFGDCFVRVTEAGVEKHPHSPDWRCNVGYDEPYSDDDPALFLSFLDEVWADLPQAERDTQKHMVGEWVGAMVTRQTPRYQAALFVEGGGSNGKSQFVLIVEGLLPANRVTHFAPQHLSSEYNLAKLANALLNATTEVPDSEITSTAAATIKALISGDTMTARNLYENAFDFTPECAVLLAANNLPLVKDTSHGFWRRMKVLRFGRQFSGTDVVRDIGKKILAKERVLIAGWALRCLPDLMQRGDYEETASSLEAKQAWRTASDEIDQWMEDVTEQPSSPGEGTPCKDVYSSYRIWAEGSGIPDSRVLTKRRFFDRLKPKMQPFLAGTAKDRHLRYPVLLRAGEAR